MIEKPQACHGCPFYGDGMGFVPDRLNEQAVVFIYGQNPGASEEVGQRWDGTTYTAVAPEPFIGKTGYVMESAYFPQAGLSRDNVSLGNAIRCRYNHKDEVPQIDRVITQRALQHCHNAHFKLPPKTRLIVAQGELAFYALTQMGLEKYNKLTDWRGYVRKFEPIGCNRTFDSNIYERLGTNYPSVLGTYHIAFTFRDPSAGLVTKWDWRKIPRILSGDWPKPLPTIQDGPPVVWPTISAFDTEFVPGSNKFLRFSLYDGKDLRVSEELKRSITIDRPIVVMHNASADLPFLSRMLLEFEVEDTMHAHAVLWSDFDHDLNFLGSMYGSINHWKHLVNANPVLYSAADAFATWEAWCCLAHELKTDPQSQSIYKIQKQLIPIIMRSEGIGIRVNRTRAKEAFLEYQALCTELSTKAQAVAGWPINIRSNKQAGHHLFKVEGLLGL